MNHKNAEPQDMTDEQLGHIIDHAYQARHGGPDHSRLTKEEACAIAHLTGIGDSMRERFHEAIHHLNRTTDDATKLDNFVDREMFTADYDPYRDLMNNFDDEGNLLSPDDTIVG